MERSVTLSEIYSKLWTLGVTANYTGFFHASYAIFLAAKQPDYLLLVTKWLYPDVAKRYQTTAKAVERNIRTVIDIIWTHHPECLKQISRQNLERKPTASQFISMLAHEMTNGQAA